MGGKGSTRWGNHRRATCVEDALKLDVARLAPALRHDQIDGILSRSSGPEDDVASRLSFFLGPVSAAGTRLLMIDPGDNRRKQPIYLERAQRGWYRSWLFRCPSDCGRRAKKLYADRRWLKFMCRKCAGLTYRSAQQHDSRLDLARRDPVGFIQSRARAPTTLKSRMVTSFLLLDAMNTHSSGRGWSRGSVSSGSRAISQMHREFRDKWGFELADVGRTARGDRDPEDPDRPCARRFSEQIGWEELSERPSKV